MTIRVTLSYDDCPAVYARGAPLAEVERQPWRPVLPGSVDEGAMRRACALLGV